MLEELLDKNIIWIQEDVNTIESLFEIMYQTLYQKKFVKQTFLKALLDREQHYPTGLELEHGMNVGIPHADYNQINHEFIAVATLSQPIKMRKMEDLDSEINISVVFLLGLKDSSKHLNILKSLIKLIQNKDILDDLFVSKDPQTIIHLLNKQMKKMGEEK